MHPILLPFPRIPTYGVMLLLAWSAGWWVARRRARRIGIAYWHVDWLVPLLALSSALGTRLAGLACQMLTGGNANDRILYGGLLLGIGVGAVYALAARVPLGQLGDAFAFSLPLGFSLLRVGCFFAGCCWGDICGCSERLAAIDDRAWRHQVQTFPLLCPEGWAPCVRFPAGSPAYSQHRAAGLLPPRADRSLPVHPVQLYEAAASLGLFGMLLLVDRRLRRGGDSLLLCLLGYALIRLVLEWFRADNAVLACDLTASQAISVLLICVCLVSIGVRAHFRH